jgi:hypothetical protein
MTLPSPSFPPRGTGSAGGCGRAQKLWEECGGDTVTDLPSIECGFCASLRTTSSGGGRRQLSFHGGGGKASVYVVAGLGLYR